MTDAEWLTCNDPQAMLEFLIGKASKRKCLLFQVGCCRRIWQFLKDERSRHAIEVTEAHADAQTTARQLKDAGMQAEEVNWAAWDRFKAAPKTGKSPRLREALAARAAMAATRMGKYTRRSIASTSAVAITAAQAAPAGTKAEFAAQASLIRCMFGSLPFRPVAAESTLLTSTVTHLAQAIYDDRAFDRMPILADALEDAGCTNADILSHCRGLGPHVLGCWVVDLLLGKE